MDTLLLQKPIPSSSKDNGTVDAAFGPKTHLSAVLTEKRRFQNLFPKVHAPKRHLVFKTPPPKLYTPKYKTRSSSHILQRQDAKNAPYPLHSLIRPTPSSSHRIDGMNERTQRYASRVCVVCLLYIHTNFPQSHHRNNTTSIIMPESFRIAMRFPCDAIRPNRPAEDLREVERLEKTSFCFSFVIRCLALIRVCIYILYVDACVVFDAEAEMY